MGPEWSQNLGNINICGNKVAVAAVRWSLDQRRCSHSNVFFERRSGDGLKGCGGRCSRPIAVGKDLEHKKVKIKAKVEISTDLLLTWPYQIYSFRKSFQEMIRNIGDKVFQKKCPKIQNLFDFGWGASACQTHPYLAGEAKPPQTPSERSSLAFD